MGVELTIFVSISNLPSPNQLCSSREENRLYFLSLKSNSVCISIELVRDMLSSLVITVLQKQCFDEIK